MLRAAQAAAAAVLRHEWEAGRPCPLVYRKRERERERERERMREREREDRDRDRERERERESGEGEERDDILSYVRTVFTAGEVRAVRGRHLK